MERAWDGFQFPVLVVISLWLALSTGCAYLFLFSLSRFPWLPLTAVSFCLYSLSYGYHLCLCSVESGAA